jgi:hypothetical protein
MLGTILIDSDLLVLMKYPTLKDLEYNMPK